MYLLLGCTAATHAGWRDGSRNEALTIETPMVTIDDTISAAGRSFVNYQEAYPTVERPIYIYSAVTEETVATYTGFQQVALSHHIHLRLQNGQTTTRKGRNSKVSQVCTACK